MDRCIQQIGDRFAGRVQFLSSNIDTGPGTALAKRFGVANIPTLVILRLNKKPTLLVGHRDAATLVREIESLLSNSHTKARWAFWQ